MGSMIERMHAGVQDLLLRPLARVLMPREGAARPVRVEIERAHPDRGLVEFVVVWKLYVEASSPECAAQEALLALTRPGSVPPMFEVYDDEGSRTLVELPEKAHALRVVHGGKRLT